ncbi:MAG: putative membrane protein [Alteromonadaceae bacterium]|jgi:uncharacterized membrane protein
MVANQCLNGNTVITLRPNRSASWLQTKLFLLIMATPMFIIALGWTIVGAWPILPFAGVEFGLLAFLTYRVCCRTYQHDKIIVKKDQVIIDCGIGDKPCIHTLKRPNVYLAVIKPKKPLDLITLSLIDDSQRIEIGVYVNQQDREHIRTALTDAGVVECVDKWWSD